MLKRYYYVVDDFITSLSRHHYVIQTCNFCKSFKSFSSVIRSSASSTFCMSWRRELLSLKWVIIMIYESLSMIHTWCKSFLAFSSWSYNSDIFRFFSVLTFLRTACCSRFGIVSITWFLNAWKCYVIFYYVITLIHTLYCLSWTFMLSRNCFFKIWSLSLRSFGACFWAVWCLRLK